MAAGTNLYKRGRRRVKSILSWRRTERLLKREAPNWKPATVLRHVLMLRFMSTEYYAFDSLMDDFLKRDTKNYEIIINIGFIMIYREGFL